MRKSLSGAIVMSLLTASVSSADVQLQLHDGRVSIVAKDATVRQILTEWARVGQTKVVNVERIPGGPLTLELNNIPEAQALDVLLRTVSGYMAAPRATAVANLSVYDRIIVMPTVAAPRPAASAAPSAPAFQQPQFTPAAPPPDDDADPPAAGVQGQQPPRPPVFNAFPPPQVGGAGASGVPAVQGGQTAQPPSFGGTPSAAPGGGVSTPGMMTQPVQPAPANPAQWRPGMPTQVQPVYPGMPTAQPGQVAQPQRPGGRGGAEQLR
jgi:hypothetical protein